MTRVLVAGVGNVFFGDDAFGVEVVSRLSREHLPGWVKVADFGIRGIHLAYEIAAGYDVVILIDAVSRDEPPGTLYIIEPDSTVAGGGEPDGHTMNIENVFSFLQRLGGSTAAFYLVGCEPENTGEGMGLSPIVASAVPAAAAMVLNLVQTHAHSEALV